MQPHPRIPAAAGGLSGSRVETSLLPRRPLCPAEYQTHLAHKVVVWQLLPIATICRMRELGLSMVQTPPEVAGALQLEEIIYSSGGVEAGGALSSHGAVECGEAAGARRKLS